MTRTQVGLTALILLGHFFVVVSNGQSTGQAMTNARSSLKTLYAFDPVESSVCFNDGDGGYIVKKHRVFNRCSHLAFDTYTKDSLTAGVQGGERGYIVDVGDATSLKQKYGYEETVGNSQGYASLHIADGTIVILKSYREQSYQALNEAEALFKDDDKLASAKVKLGHIYLVRIKRGQSEKDILVKALVVAYRPGESVVLRWSEL
jgi:hypothetical protein